MDTELLFALLVLWSATTMLLIVFLTMWFDNYGEAFHPHSVDVEARHPYFLVVNSKTICKKEFAVKSISAFVAPRGASSSKYFTFLTGVVAITGILGSSRWYFVGDATWYEACISIFGFFSLVFVACFELDVEPTRFLEDKMIVTGWLINKLGLEKDLDFSLSSPSNEYREFLRKSPEIYHLYEEDRYLHARDELKAVKIWTYNGAWLSFHCLGAIIYVALVPLAICLNDIHEKRAAGVVMVSFTFFSLMGYLTGNYMPVLKIFQCWLLTWNPFVREPHFMMKLKRSVKAYAERNSRKTSLKSDTANKSDIALNNTTNTTTKSSSSNSIARKRSNSGDNLLTSKDTTTSSNSGRISSSNKLQKHRSTTTVSHDDMNNNNDSHNGDDDDDDHLLVLEDVSSKNHSAKLSQTDLEESKEANKSLDTMILKYAHGHPKEYLHIAGYVVVLSELVALLTPSVLLGIQWITAFCSGPTVYAILDLLYLYFNCVFNTNNSAGDATCNLDDLHSAHCILRKI